jgi:GMP synthase (glutamine-hydrolysing)
MSHIVVVQHAEVERPGIIADVLASQGNSVLTFHAPQLPQELEDAQGLIIMGGPMSVYEDGKYPFLRDELHLIEKALQEGKPVLGVCLGSQLLAAALGAAVKKGQKEIGWYQVALTKNAMEDPLLAGVERSFMACHWHGDIFDLPHGALSLAASSRTECQAFRYGDSAYGFLFHMEVTHEILQAMVRTFADELRGAGIEGEEIVRGGHEYLPDLKRIGKAVFKRWAGLNKTR